MLEKKCVLLLYGEGRYDTSIMAVKDYLESKGNCYVVAISDKELYPFYRYKMAFHAYKFCARSCAWVNNLRLTCNTFMNKLNIKKSQKEYKEFTPAKDGLMSIFYSWTEQYRRIRNVLLKYQPEVVICSTPKLLRDATKACDKAKMKNIDICGLITDYCLDTRFVNYKANRYFVQNKSVSERLISFGIQEEAISIISTPILQKSKEKFDRAQVLGELGINNDYLNLVMVGGRYGQSAIRSVFTTVAELKNDINIIVLSGGNNGLVKYCELIAKNREIIDRVYLIEEIDDYAKLYAVADILITSPTATITYEAMYHNLNLITCKGGDAIENRNAHYLASNQLALLGRNNDELVESISKFMTDLEFCEEIKNSQNEFVVSNGDKILGDMILKIADKNRDNKQNKDNKTIEEKCESDDKKLLKASQNKEKV